MHDQGIVHGDLKGVRFRTRSSPSMRGLPGPKANILINHNGHACLADFSLLTIAPDQSTVISTCIEGGTIQWMSPELLHPEHFGLKKSRPTKESDCYALGMVVYEVLGGQTPFAPAKAIVVIWKVLEGHRPERPQREEGRLFTDAIWKVLELCWKHEPSDRPSAKSILQHLEGTPSLLQSSSNADGAVETDTDQSDDSASDSGMCSLFRLRSQVHLRSFSWYIRSGGYA